MYAVVKTGAKQFRVSPGDVIKVEKLGGEVGDSVTLGEIMMVGGDAPEIGAPLVDGASVAASILEQARDKKVIVFKKRRRQNYRRKKGHRQHMTVLRIDEILTGGAKPSGKKAEAPRRQQADDQASEAQASTGTENPVIDMGGAGDAGGAPAEKATENRVPEPGGPASTGVVDDVSLIGGVGPKMKLKLAENGIETLEPIAAMDDETRMRLEAAGLLARAEKEEWQEQAKELLAGKPPRAKADQKAAAQTDEG